MSGMSRNLSARPSRSFRPARSATTPSLSAIRFRINPLFRGGGIRYETSMPDYTSILRRSVAALPDPSPGMREAVYQRARAALARQLTAVVPPLSSREIEAQHQE